MTPSPNPAEKLLESLVNPLLERIRLGKPALGIAFHQDEHLDSRWNDALLKWGKIRGLHVEHLLLSELGEAPAAALLKRNRAADHLFSIEIAPGDLPDPALGKGSPVTVLNIHRDTFRDENLALLLWIPQSLGPRFFEFASNLADYRTTLSEIPPFPQEDAPNALDAPPETESTHHNLPFASLGHKFIGRERELEQLRQLLAGEGHGAIVDTLALEGLGGVGKTRLAIEYAWRHLGDYDYIHFLRADSSEQLRINLAALTREDALDLDVPDESSDAERIQAVFDWLDAHERWLIILDNADSADVAHYISTDVLPNLQRGHVLLTSRFRRWGGEVSALKVEVFDTDDAVAFLADATQGRRRETSNDDETARQLADIVDGLPLALEQIAAWICQRQESFASALEAITDESGDVLSWYDPKSIRYPRPVAAVWEQALESLDEEEAFLLRYLAWLAPGPVPDLLVSAAAEPKCWRGETEEAPDFMAVAHRLEDRSLLTAGAAHSFVLHRLWQELERRRTPSAQRHDWQARIAAAIASCTPKSTDDVRNWPRIELLLPHAAALFEQTSATADPEFTVNHLSYLLNQFGLYWKTKSNFAEAEALYRRALEAEENVRGPDHPEVAIHLNNLASLLQATNRLAEAEEPRRRALAIDEASFGPDHPNVATDLNNLALLLKATNRLEEAEEPMRRALAIDEASFGPDHPRVARDLNNLALLLKATDRMDQAEEPGRRALAIDEASFGPDHPNVAIDLNNLALLLKATKRMTEAEEPMRRALAIFVRSLGAEHPNSKTVAGNLIGLLQELGRDEAEVEEGIRQLLDEG